MGRQLRLLTPLIVCWVLAGGLLVAVASQDGARRTELLLAPVTVGELTGYTGLVGSLGVLAWAVAATAAFGAAGIANLGGRRSAARFLTHAGIYSVVLGLDDLFELHAAMAPTGLGVPKVAVVAGLAGALVPLLAVNWREVMRTRTVVLAASLVALGGALVIDTASRPGSGALVAEEGLQFLGIVAWAVWLCLTATDIGVSVLSEHRLERVGSLGGAVARADGRGAASAEPVENGLGLVGLQEQH